MRKKDFLSIARGAALVFIMGIAGGLAVGITGCENPAGLAVTGGTGQVYIGLARSGAARTVVPDDAELQALTIKVTFTGPGGTIEKTFDRQGGTVVLAVGSWRLTAKAYGPDRLRAIAEETLQVKSSGTHNIAMTACIGIRSEADLAAALGAGGLPGIGHDTTSGKGDLLVLENDITTGPITAAPGNYTLAGSGTITLSGQGSLFTVNSGVTLTLDGPTLRGPTLSLDSGPFNNASLVRVNNGGQFTMINGNITDNIAFASGGGVLVQNGTFTMSGGTISNNYGTDGGGVFIDGSGSSFTMTGGTITGNTSSGGGGVKVGPGSNSSFTMSGGTISGNSGEGSSGSGGVYVYNSSFTMSGGTISGNTSSSGGGGVCVYSVANNSSFTMSAGTISGNSATATSGGGGVFIYGSGGSFTMTGGTISGNTSSGGGGGVLAQDSSALFTMFTMSGGTITGNTSGTSGGGVCVSNATFTLNLPATRSNVTGNNTPQVYLSGGTVSGTAGETDGW